MNTFFSIIINYEIHIFYLHALFRVFLHQTITGCLSAIQIESPILYLAIIHVFHMYLILSWVSSNSGAELPSTI